jgi:hypothetical protein
MALQASGERPLVFKDAPADFAVNAGGELTELTTDAFDFSNSLGVGGSKAFCTGERVRFWFFMRCGRPLWQQRATDQRRPLVSKAR